MQKAKNSQDNVREQTQKNLRYCISKLTTGLNHMKLLKTDELKMCPFHMLQPTTHKYNNEDTVVLAQPPRKSPIQENSFKTEPLHMDT